VIEWGEFLEAVYKGEHPQLPIADSGQGGFLTPRQFQRQLIRELGHPKPRLVEVKRKRGRLIRKWETLFSIVRRKASVVPMRRGTK
jgi:hypothetical protein